MLRHPNGRPMPIVDENEQVELFDSEEDAEKWCSDSDAAQAWGYEIYEW